MNEIVECVVGGMIVGAFVGLVWSAIEVLLTL